MVSETDNTRVVSDNTVTTHPCRLDHSSVRPNTGLDKLDQRRHRIIGCEVVQSSGAPMSRSLTDFGKADWISGYNTNQHMFPATGHRCRDRSRAVARPADVPSGRRRHRRPPGRGASVGQGTTSRQVRPTVARGFRRTSDSRSAAHEAPWRARPKVERKNRPFGPRGLEVERKEPSPRSRVGTKRTVPASHLALTGLTNRREVQRRTWMLRAFCRVAHQASATSSS